MVSKWSLSCAPGSGTGSVESSNENVCLILCEILAAPLRIYVERCVCVYNENLQRHWACASYRLRDIFQWKLITQTRLQLSAVARCPPHTFIYHSLTILRLLMTVFMHWVRCVTDEVKCVCTVLWTGVMFTLCTPSSIAASRTICRGGAVLHQTFRGIETVWSVKINH